MVEGRLMIKGEAILIEQVVNGFIVNPKDITNFTKNDKDIYVFGTIDELKIFLDKHFNKQEKGDEK